MADYRDDLFVLSVGEMAWIGEQGKVEREVSFYGGPLDGDRMTTFLITRQVYVGAKGEMEGLGSYTLSADGTRYEGFTPPKPITGTLTEWTPPDTLFGHPVREEEP